MNRRQARKFVYGILSLGEVTGNVDAQLDANPNLERLSAADKRRIMAKADAFEQEIFKRAGEEVLHAITVMGYSRRD